MSSPTTTTTTPATNATTLAGRVRNLANLHKPHIDIELTGESHAIRTYSTFDKIEGSVSINAPSDTRFDSVEITLIGTARSFVDKMTTVSAVNGRTEAFQQFLKLQQPMGANAYPNPPVLQQDTQYTFPFEFVVPEHLLPSSCRHKTNNPKLKHSHLQLPPSMGDPEIAGYGSVLKDDLAPSMARIQYGIRVRIIRNRDRDEKEMILAARTHKISIIPAQEEQPPITFDERDEEYCTRKEKTLKKGVFKGKLGRLAMETVQPKSFRLPSPSASLAPPENVTTVATVNLRFDPVDAQSQPPKLNSLSSKLKVATYFASAPRSDFPSKTHAIYDTTQGLYVEALPLSSRCMASIAWEKHEAPASRRDSAVSLDAPAYETSSVPKPTTASSDNVPFYTAQLLVPLTLPTNKAFLPTFHSCLISRIYVLELALSVPVLGAGPNSTMTLKVPVQISADSGNQAVSRRASDALIEAESLASSPELEYFQPRRVGSVSDARPPPPGYSSFPTARAGGAPRMMTIPEAPAYTAIR